jgi:hypothetical protein
MVGISPPPRLPSVRPPEYVLGPVPVLPLRTTAPESMVGAGVVGPAFSGLENSYLTLLHMASRTSPSFLLCCPCNRDDMPTSFPVPLFLPPGTWHSCQPLPGLPGHEWLYSATGQSPHSLSFMLRRIRRP